MLKYLFDRQFSIFSIIWLIGMVLPLVLSKVWYLGILMLFIGFIIDNNMNKKIIKKES